MEGFIVRFHFTRKEPKLWWCLGWSPVWVGLRWAVSVLLTLKCELLRASSSLIGAELRQPSLHPLHKPSLCGPHVTAVRSCTSTSCIWAADFVFCFFCCCCGLIDIHSPYQSSSQVWLISGFSRSQYWQTVTQPGKLCPILLANVIHIYFLPPFKSQIQPPWRQDRRQSPQKTASFH